MQAAIRHVCSYEEPGILGFSTDGVFFLERYFTQEQKASQGYSSLRKFCFALIIIYVLDGWGNATEPKLFS